jgi:hypothetical protein
MSVTLSDQEQSRYVGFEVARKQIERGGLRDRKAKQVHFGVEKPAMKENTVKPIGGKPKRSTRKFPRESGTRVE